MEFAMPGNVLAIKANAVNVTCFIFICFYCFL